MSKAQDDRGERPAEVKKPSREDEIRRVIREYIDDQIAIVRMLRRWLN